ncbi:cytochrome c [Ancylobacter sp. IITR112]|uniref:cytochrome c n=1 Tax=Ancylobacter sp. IITR112 TaxID=3138073 RepID=UPI00352B1961
MSGSGGRSRGSAARRARGVRACIALTVAGLTFAAGRAEAREPFKPDAFATYAPDVANGEVLAHAAGCVACHASGENGRLLAGGRRLDTFIGSFYVPNITDHAKGAGGFSNADYLNAVINGIAPDGRHYYPVFPYAAYAGMKPEDVLDIKAYIATLPASDTAAPRHVVGFPYNLDATLALWQRGNFDTPAFQPGDGSQRSRGRYLVEAVGACGECHTPRTLTYGLDKARRFEGEKGLSGEAAPPITPAQMAVFAQGDAFRTYIEEAQKPSGAPVASPLKRQWLAGLARLPEADRLAMLAYLTDTDITPNAPEKRLEPSCSAAAPPAIALNELAAKADDVVGRYCRNCHGPGESAQGSFPAGDLAAIAANPAFVTPGNRGASLLFTSISSGRMPYGTKPSAEELEALGAWIDQLSTPAPAAPPQRPARQRDLVTTEAMQRAALADLESLPAEDRRFIRYVSFHTLHNGVAPCEDARVFARRLDLFQASFRKLYNSVSLGPQLVTPPAVAGSRDLLLRIDLRDSKWTAAQWERLLAAYPFARSARRDPALAGLTHGTGTDIPLIRADWFMANASRPENYHLLLALPAHIGALEQRIGVDVNANIRDRKVARAAFLEGSSGVSDHNRLLERHDLPHGGYYWKSYDFAGSRDTQNLRSHPHGPPDAAPLAAGLAAFEHDGGEMIFSLPNGLQGYYLSTGKGDRIDRGPTEVVSFRQRPIGKGIDIVNGRSCMDCHSDGIIAKRDQLRAHLASSVAFSRPQQELLLALYVDQIELDRLYAQDRAAFIAALERIGAAEKAPDGSLKSRRGPAEQELATWFADQYEANLDEDQLAAEFDLLPEELEKAVLRVREESVRTLAIDWLTQLKAGVKVPRFEVDRHYGTLMQALHDIEPLRQPAEGADAPAPVALPDYKDADYRDDAYRPEGSGGKLELSVRVPRTTVRVNEKLRFDVTANRRCELQLLYVEATGEVEVIPQEMIGAPFLEPGRPRRIPQEGVGDLVFDTPAYNETLLAFCREGGLGAERLDAARARALIAASGAPPSRGLAIKLVERQKAQAAAAPQRKGRAAINMLSFSIRD